MLGTRQECYRIFAIYDEHRRHDGGLEYASQLPGSSDALFDPEIELHSSLEQVREEDIIIRE
jgi:hypothetical protein